MTALPGKPAPRSSITAPRVAAAVAGWLTVAWLAAPSLGLYYEALATFLLVPPLILVHGYCLSHRRRATALLACIASIVVVLAIAISVVIHQATSV